MFKKIRGILKEYASGKFSESEIEITPSGIFLFLKEPPESISESEITSLKANLKNELNINAEVISLSKETSELITKTLITAIYRSTNTNVQSLFFELRTKDKCSIIITLENNTAPITTKNKIKEICEKICSAFSIISSDIIISEPQPALTDATILGTIVENAPISFDILANLLEVRHLEGQNALRLSLDRLRKKNMIGRQQSGTYVAQENALYLFSSIYSKNSSDIKRALVLARKKW